MRLIPIILILIIFLSACSNIDDKVQNKVECTERSDFCTQQYDPVIGSDGKEYSNGCTACSHEEVNYYEKK